MRRSRVIDLMLVLAIIGLFAVPLGLRLNATGAAEGEAYPGSDGSAAEVVQQIDPGFSPWFSPWFEPSSGEIESGLFALQAALGAALFGFALGRLSGRRRAGGRAAVAGPRPGP